MEGFFRTITAAAVAAVKSNFMAEEMVKLSFLIAHRAQQLLVAKQLTQNPWKTNDFPPNMRYLLTPEYFLKILFFKKPIKTTFLKKGSLLSFLECLVFVVRSVDYLLLGLAECRILKHCFGIGGHNRKKRM